MTLDEERIQDIYNRLLDYSHLHDANPDLLTQVAAWQEGKWRIYLRDVLGLIPTPLEDKVVVDFGCRYGLLFPLLLELGAKKIIGIEDLDLFLEPGIALFQEVHERVEFMKSEYGYVPIQPAAIDVVIMNEVISHVNPSYIPIVYSEVARILKPGGVLIISDNNNLGYPPYFHERLIPLYEVIENGPDGIEIEDVVVSACLLNQRKRIVQSRHPDMPAEQVEYLAKNTSGLSGDYFLQVVDRFARTGELIRRPYRMGIPPVYPEWGQVEERGFYPQQVTLELMRYGFDCEVLDTQYLLNQAFGRKALQNTAIKPASGYTRYAYESPIPEECPRGSRVVLMEDSNALPFPTDNHSEISEKGMGRYSVWRANGTIYFSASDGTDPRNNGHVYELFWMVDQNKVVYGSPKFQIIALKKS